LLPTTVAGWQSRPIPNFQTPGPRERPERGTVHGIHPDELVRLAPRLRPYLGRPNPIWPEIIDAADWLRHDLDVSKPLWGEACLTLGRDLAAVALALVSTKDPEHFRTTPGGYFHGMVQKAKAGELHLERTVWALRRAGRPGQLREAGRGGAATAVTSVDENAENISLRLRIDARDRRSLDDTIEGSPRPPAVRP
jgi:hypothetical protein